MVKRNTVMHCVRNNTSRVYFYDLNHAFQRLFAFPRFHNLAPSLFTTKTILPMSVQIENSVPISTEASPPKKKIKMPTDNVTLKFAKLTQNAFSPTRGSKFAAGFDLYSAYDAKIPAKGKAVVKTDIQIALPDGCYGRVAPRSGLAAKHFIDVGAGVIDQDYRGNVGVVMFNFSEDEFTVLKGDRIAQLVCERIYMPDLEELPSLDETDRGSGGFGSTGKN